MLKFSSWGWCFLAESLEKVPWSLPCKKPSKCHLCLLIIQLPEVIQSKFLQLLIRIWPSTYLYHGLEFTCPPQIHPGDGGMGWSWWGSWSSNLMKFETQHLYYLSRGSDHYIWKSWHQKSSKDPLWRWRTRVVLMRFLTLILSEIRNTAPPSHV